MPRREDIHSILILGSGPIVIGQGCEFDYSGTQACKALREEGYRVVLVNSNPATIMTDPAFSDRTYIEPITPEAVDKDLEREADAGHADRRGLLPTLGGQTALNCAMRAARRRHAREARRRDDRRHARGDPPRRGSRPFRRDRGGASAWTSAPRSGTVDHDSTRPAFLDEIGCPAIIRPAFTLGGIGGGIAVQPRGVRGDRQARASTRRR